MTAPLPPDDLRALKSLIGWWDEAGVPAEIPPAAPPRREPQRPPAPARWSAPA